jgi:hypothetical protein
MSNANQTDVIEESFVLHGKEFHDMNCEIDDEGVNLCPIVVYEKGGKFRNVDSKEFENVMNMGCQNSKHIETQKRSFGISNNIMGFLLT